MASLRTERGEIVLNTLRQVDAPSQQKAPSIWHPCAPSKSWAGLSFAAARMSGANMLWSRRTYPRQYFFARSGLVHLESLGESVVTSLDSFKSRKTLTVGGKAYDYFSLKAAEK